MHKNYFCFSPFVISFFLSIGCISAVFSQNINTEQSKVTFEIANTGLNTVEGSFTGMNGTLQFDENNLGSSSFNVCINASTINTGNKSRDKHLKNEDFFDVEKYPTICFKSESISQSSFGFVAKGSLTMHGITKAIEIPFVYKNQTFTGNFFIKRLDYGVGPNSGFSVGKEVEIQITCKIK